MMDVVHLLEREGWAMLMLAEQMRVMAAALGEESEFASCLRRQIPDLSAAAEARLAPDRHREAVLGRSLRVVR